MKHILLIIAALFTLSVSALAQTDTITIKEGGFAPVFRKDGKTLSMKGIERLLKDDAEATGQLKKAKATYTIANAFSFAGGFAIGYSLGTALGSGKAIQPAGIYVGLACIAVAIPINISARNKMRPAVETYNNGRRRTTRLQYRPEFYLAVNGNSMALVMRF